jgi:arsenate reductase
MIVRPARAQFGAGMKTTVRIFGIKNCDTMKKARTWLDQHQIEYTFHDYKASGIDAAHLERWCRELGWESVLNRNGTTFRKLPQPVRESVNQKSAMALMLEQPSTIKRPLLERGTKLVAGFRAEEYAKLFAMK